MITKVIVRAEVEDVERWKNGFVTHSDSVSYTHLTLPTILLV